MLRGNFPDVAQLKRERGQLEGDGWQLRATQAELAGVVVGYRSLSNPPTPPRR